MTGRAGSFVALTILAVIPLAACQTNSGATAGAALQSPGEGPIVKEVEAPEVFQMTGKGLWDGRPSLGGIWVAHYDVKDPERVIIRNIENGKSVTGALFRRERVMPGPGIQISSDAAEALGILAGQPTELSIVALRKKEIELPPPPETSRPAQDEPEAAETDPAPATSETPPIDVPGATAPAAAAPRKTSGGFFGLFRGKPKAPAAPATGTTAASGAIEQTSLDPVEPQPAPASAGNLARPLIQIATFTTEENANKAAEKARNAGLETRVIRVDGSTRPYWRVVIGPASSIEERDAMLARARELGFADAYPVSS